MKYRLKKDTPEFKAGQMFTRLKYDYGDYGDDCLFAGISPGVSPVPAFDISLIDNFDEWFEEVEEESDPLFEELTHDDQGNRVAINIWFRKNRDGSHSKKMVDFIQFMEAINVVSQDEGFMRKNGGGFGWPVIEYTTNNPGVEDIAERQHAGEFYFDTREHALASANNHTRAWQTILNYDWGKGND